MCVCVCVQLVRLLFWNRHSTEQHVDLDEQDLTSAAAETTAAAAATTTDGCVNTAYDNPDDDTAANSQSARRHNGLPVPLSSLVHHLMNEQSLL